VVWVISIFVNVGMWFERFVITVTSLANDFLPSSWGYYSPTIVDIYTYVGTFGIFAFLFLLFLRFMPLIAIAEIKALALPQADPHNEDHPLNQTCFQGDHEQRHLRNHCDFRHLARDLQGSQAGAAGWVYPV
jgi:hypothetical protein